MEYGIIKKQEIEKLIKAAAEEYAAYAPVEGKDGPEFKQVDGGEEIIWDYQNLKLSPKGIFFPQMETLYTFDYDTIEEIPVPDRKYLVLGSRPCDALALSYLDEIFSEENKGYYDPYYMRRREGSVMVSIACNEPCATCFCTSVEGGPGDEKGSDIIAADLGDELLFRAVSEKGEAFMKEHESVFSKPEEGQKKKAEELAKQAEDAMEKIDFGKETLKEHMDNRFNDEQWKRMSQSCIGCGTCTYLCPTCYCFDISDEQKMYKGRRIRTWDSCQYPQFTKHASGHNPRSNKTQRLRQRFMHKFSYTVENQGDIFCVGCGRCIKYCPVNIDIREFIKEFANK
jgi:heterodisulfide reductase subunit C